MTETVFYIAGSALVLAALTVTALGLQWRSFPSKGAMVAMMAGVTCLVVATAAYALLSAREEQEQRRNELAAEEAEQPQEQEPVATAPTETEPETGAPEPQGPSGEQVFLDAGCASCHALAAADATGTVGPDLDEAVAGESAEQIRTSIVDPDAQIAEGFSAGIMPGNFAEQLSPAEIDALAAFIAQSAGG